MKNTSLRYIQKEQTTTRILDAAYSIFAHHDYNSTKLDEIASNANVTKGLIVQRFGSKENLYTQILKNSVINDFPSLCDCKNLKEALFEIIGYIKKTASSNKEKFSFLLNALNTFDTLPEESLLLFENIFVNSDLYKHLNEGIRNGDIIKQNPFDMFIAYLSSISNLTLFYLNSNYPLLTDNDYLKFFMSTYGREASKESDSKKNHIIYVLSTEFDFVGYVFLQKDKKKDVLEIYKKGEFFSSVVPVFETSISTHELINMIHDSLVVEEDKASFYKSTRREAVIENLTSKQSYSVDFKVLKGKDIVPFELYFVSFVAPNEDIECFAMCLKEKDKDSQLDNLMNEYEKLDAFSQLFIDNLQSIYFVDLSTGEYSAYKENPHQDKLVQKYRNFELMCMDYIDLYVDDSDKDKMREYLTLTNVIRKFESSDSFSIVYREIFDGESNYYRMQAIKTKNGKYAAFGFSNIHEDFEKDKSVENKIKKLVEKRSQELMSKTISLNKTSEGMVELLSDIANVRAADSKKTPSQIKSLTYILATSLQHYYPQYNLSNEEIEQITLSSSLRDIGKIVIEDKIILKPANLTPEEFEIAKTHVDKGVELIEKLTKYWSEKARRITYNIVRFHHERWNGEGYPLGLKGDQIPLESQIVSIADCFDALCRERVYKGPYEPQKAFEMIVDGACGSFNPDLLNALKRSRIRFIEAIKYGDKTATTAISNFVDQSNDNFRGLSFNSDTLPVIEAMSEEMPNGFLMFSFENEEIIYFNKQIASLYGCYDSADFLNYVNKSFRNTIHKDDYEDAMLSIRMQLQKNRTSFSHIVYRIVSQDRQIKWVEVCGNLVHSDTHGEIYYVFVTDITEQHNLRIINRNLEKMSNTDEKNIPVTSLQSKTGVKSLEGTRILLIDDDELSRMMTKDSLEQEGSSVTDVASGHDAFDVIKKVQQFDIILCDLVMPDSDGASVTYAIRKYEADKDYRVPIVILTSDPNSELAKAALKAGADGLMSKPLIISELSRILILAMKDYFKKIADKLRKTVETAQTDILTHVKSMGAYSEKINEITLKIKQNRNYNFALVICDINDLKRENDTYGHDSGDLYIKNCSKMICDIFAHSPVYRIGGDEFVIVLEDEDYKNCDRLFDMLIQLNEISQEINDVEHGKASLSAGLAAYDKNVDKSVNDVFKRADTIMYDMKRRYKIERQHPLTNK